MVAGRTQVQGHETDITCWDLQKFEGSNMGKQILQTKIRIIKKKEDEENWSR